MMAFRYSRGASIKTRIETGSGGIVQLVLRDSRGASIKTRIETRRSHEDSLREG